MRDIEIEREGKHCTKTIEKFIINKNINSNINYFITLNYHLKDKTCVIIFIFIQNTNILQE